MKPSVLIVDDEENIRFGFTMILTDAGYDVITASDYDSALGIISKNVPDVIISDILLGEQTGIDLLNEIKKMNIISPVIMITGEPNVDTSSVALRLGAFDYVAKPIRKETLLRMTLHGLRHKELLTNKKQLEINSLIARRNMEAIFRSLKDGIITVNNDMQVIEANDAVEGICRFPVANLIGENYENFKTKCCKGCISALKNILKTGEEVGEFQIKCEHPDKQGQIVMLTGSPLTFHGIKPFGAVLVIRDMTRLSNLEQELKERHQFHKIIGKSHKMQQIYTLFENLADIDSTVLITGETGTGKELAAAALHHNSERRKKPFIKVNCSALSENLLESELFGHVKGAFTGAVKDKKGRFEKADKGTLFLDEIGDISPLIQLKLLRVLQEKEFDRVGDSTTVHVDVRIIAATNRNLKEMVARGKFREDLYYRIKVVDTCIPPLRERREDIPLLADHFLNKFNNSFKKQIRGFSRETINVFMNYPWPGNVRELEHAIEHSFVLCQGNTMLFEHLPVELKEYSKGKCILKAQKPSDTREEILRALEKTDWNKAKAARILGIGRRTIYRKIEEFKINPPTK